MAKSDKSNKMYQNFPQFFMLLFAMQIFATLSISTPDFKKRTKSVAGGKKRAPHPRVFAWNFVHSGQKFCRENIKANQRFRLLKRTCHFVHNKNRKRVLLLFEHCPIVWRLWSNTVIGRLDSIQKRAIKWIYDNLGSPSDAATAVMIYYITFSHSVSSSASPNPPNWGRIRY